MFCKILIGVLAVLLLGCGGAKEEIKQDVVVQGKVIKATPFRELQKLNKYYDLHVYCKGYVVRMGQDDYVIPGDFFDKAEIRWKLDVGEQRVNVYRLYENKPAKADEPYITLVQSIQYEPLEEYALPIKFAAQGEYLIFGLVRYDRNQKKFFIQVFSAMVQTEAD